MVAIPDPASWAEPFPLNDMQQAYWVGRSEAFEGGRVVSQFFFEIVCDMVYADRVGPAWRRIIERHAALRCVVLPDGTQRVLPPQPYEPERVDLRQDADAVKEARRAAIREEMCHRSVALEQWPHFDLRLLLDERATFRIFLALEFCMLDGTSITRVLSELSTLCRDPDAPLAPVSELSFRDYVLAQRELEKTDAYARALDYWRQRVGTLPAAPSLRLAARAPEGAPRFVRRVFRLDATTWQRFSEHARANGVTRTVALGAAYAEVLAVWSGDESFTLNLPRHHRAPVHPDASRVVGQLASFTLLEVNRSGERFADRARDLDRQLRRDLEHSLVSGVAVLRELTRSGRTNVRMPFVFTSLLNLSIGRDSLTSSSLGEMVHVESQTPQVLIDNQISEVDGELVVTWDGVDAAFAPDLVASMFDGYEKLLRQLSTAEGWSSPAFDLVPESQRAVRAAMNATDRELPARELLHDACLAACAERGDALAVIDARRQLTYEELGARVHTLARVLRERGVEVGSRVAIVMEKGWEQVVAVLATLAAGAAYVPIDPEVPPARLAELLGIARPTLSLTQATVEARAAWPEGAPRLTVSDAAPDRHALPLPRTASPSDLAYVLFTSGTTGSPKAVMIEHAGAVNAVRWTNRRFDVNTHDRVLGVTSLHHDMSVFDVFAVLAAGGTLVLPSVEGARDPRHWATCVLSHGVTIWNSVPALLEMLVDDVSARGVQLPLRTAFVGGDWIARTLPERLRRVAPNAELVSVGGPTETTLWNIFYCVDAVEADWSSIPYGVPIDNARYHVLGNRLAPCPDWAPGELHCAGIGLTRGYLDDEARTREKLIAHPTTGERLYATGDRGCIHPDGWIELLGRVDAQVKVHGHRIEPGEVEFALQACEGVSRAAVMADGEGAARELVAYVVPRTGAIDEQSIRTQLRARLPAHLVPSRLFTISALPLTRNGKIDRTALRSLPRVSASGPALAAGPVASGGAVARQPSVPKGSIADIVGRVVGGVLRMEHVPRDADLVSLGASSIDLMRLVGKLDEALGVRPSMIELLRMQTVQRITRHYEKVLGEARTEVEGDGPWRAFELVFEPEARLRFKDERRGLRTTDGPWVSLPAGPAKTALADVSLRASRRRFGTEPLPLASLGGLLTTLRAEPMGRRLKFLYASAGGTYAVQTYLHVRPGRVADVEAGFWHYDPVGHRLARLSGGDIDASVHFVYNQAMLASSAFSLFFVAEYAGIAPLYGAKSRDFALIESGAMASALELAAASFGIGLCQIGDLEFEAIAHRFALAPSHGFVHSMLGGPVSWDIEEI